MAATVPIDLRQVPSSRLCGLLLAHLQACGSAEVLHFLLREDPEWAMRSADLHLQHRLRWHTERDGQAAWHSTVHQDHDAQSDGLIDLLLRDHRRLDALFARTLRAFNGGEREIAAALFAQCAQALGAHLTLEDEVLVPALGGGVSLEIEAAEAMRREHAEISVHLHALQSTLDEEPTDCSEAAILCAMLCGLLAKHEHREEMSLFPLWQLALARLDDADRTRLCAQARARLGVGSLGLGA